MSEAKWTETVVSAADHFQKRKHKTGIKLLEQSLLIAERARDFALRAESLTLLSLAACGLKKWKAALEYQKRAIAIASVYYGFTTLQHGQSLYMLADIYFMMEDYKNAEATAILSEKILDKLGLDINDAKSRPLLIVNNFLLAQICFRRGEKEQAMEWLKKYARKANIGDPSEQTPETLERMLEARKQVPIWEAIPQRIRSYTHVHLCLTADEAIELARQLKAEGLCDHR